MTNESAFARRALIKTWPDYAARRFHEMTRDFVESWPPRQAEYRAALEALPDNQQALASQLFDLTLEWLATDETRQAEIDECGLALIHQLNDLKSEWFDALRDVYAPPGTPLFEEWLLAAEHAAPALIKEY